MLKPKAFQLRDAKGFFIQTNPEPLASVQTAAHLREAILPTMAAPGSREAKRFASALDALQALPVFEASVELTAADAAFDHARWSEGIGSGAEAQTGVAPCHGWHRICGSVGASGWATQTDCRDAKEAGWLDIAAAAESLDLINQMLAKSTPARIIDTRALVNPLKGASTAAKRAAGIVFEPMPREGQFFEAANYLLFVEDAGYMDGKGGIGPLARARGFETPAAAARAAAAQARSFAWKIVEARVSIVKAADHAGDSMGPRLAAALAQAEARALEQALESASVERLRSRLAQLEALQAAGRAHIPGKDARL